MANSQVPQKPPDPNNSPQPENENNQNIEEYDNCLIFDSFAVDLVENDMTKTSGQNPSIMVGSDTQDPSIMVKTDTGMVNNNGQESRLKKKASISGPKLGHVTLLMCLTLVACFGNAMATRPMICKTDHPVAKFQIPKIAGCDLKREHMDMHEPTNADITLYKPNLIQYKSKANHCKIIRTDITTHAGFFGENKNKTTTHTTELVSRELCDDMVRFKRAPFGDLTEVGGLYQTQIATDFEFHTGFKCCTDYDFSAKNAYLYESVVYMRHGENERMQSPVGNTEHCDYHTGFCNLFDGSALMWELNPKEECLYLPHTFYQGKLQDRTWLSNDGELALTISNEQTRRIEQSDTCGGYVDMTDQGVAIKMGDQTKTRSTRQQDGTVLSSELNARLQALDIRINKNYNQMFHTTFRITCQNMVKLADLMFMSLDEHPIQAARHLLNNTFIYAKKLHEFIIVYPCQPVDDFTILPSEKCTERIPMSISFGTTIINQTMWLNPHTNILHDSANHIDCALDDQVPVVLNGKLNVYHHTTGDVTIASGIDKINLFAFDYSDLGHDLNQPVIHKLLLYDWHLFRDKFTLNDLTGAMQHQHQILGSLTGFSDNYYDGTSASGKQTEVLSHNIVKKGLFTFMSGIGLADWKQIWIFFCCLLVSFRFTWSMIRLCTGAKQFMGDPRGSIKHYFLGGNIQNSKESNQPNINVNVTQQTASPSEAQPEPQPDTETPLSIEPQPTVVIVNENPNASRPARARKYPNHRVTAAAIRKAKARAATRRESDVLCNAASLTHESLVNVSIHGGLFQCLIDTGAQISTMTFDMVRTLTLQSKMSKTLRSIRSVCGSVVKGIGEVFITISHPIRIQSELDFLLLGNANIK